jgi:phosphoribosylpyrophosphate synthetase
LFLANFANNDVTLSQFQVMICLLQSFIESLTVVLPYYPVGTMERVTKEGTVATAATFAHMFSSLPSCGRPTRLMVYDLHTLQNRFYLVRYFLVAGYAYMHMHTNRTVILVFVPMRQYIATKLLWLLASRFYQTIC